MKTAFAPERFAPDRPRTIGKGRRYPADGAALAAAIEAAGASQAEVADALAVAPQGVSSLCAGERALHWERVEQLPDAVVEALFAREMARRSALKAAPVENHLALCADLADDPAAPLLTGLADGVLTRAEVAAVDEKAGRMRAALARWERLRAMVLREGVVGLLVGGVAR